MNIEILGKSFQMSMGLDAIKEITEFLGCSLEQLGDTISAAAMEDKFVMYAHMAEAMMKSARRKKKLECKMFGEECPDEIIPSADEILSCYYLSENTGLITAVLQTMKETQAGTVEIKEKKGKNGESHASK